MVKAKYLGIGVFTLALIALVSTGCIPGITAPGVNSAATTVEDKDGAMTAGEVKEFTMTSFYEIVDGQPQPQFSMKEITVTKGDKVRIKVTNIRGIHDFSLDEFNISEDTPLDQEVVIEFTADQAGTFEYYCNQPGHRALGHWGTLTVLE